MVLTARLHIKGHRLESEGIPLLTCNYRFSQDIDQRGLPKSEVKGGVITMSFGNMNDYEIMYWMMSSKADKSGKIIFAGDETEKAFKTLEFKDARCISYQDSFVRDTEMLMEISISAREISISGVSHVNTWTMYESGK